MAAFFLLRLQSNNKIYRLKTFAGWLLTCPSNPSYNKITEQKREGTIMGRAKKLTASILLFITMLFCAFSGCTEAQPVISPVSSNPAASSDTLSRALPSALNVEAVSGSPASSAALSYPDYPAQPPRPDKRPRVAYLTFDDGPTEMTPQILDILKQYDVKATFFVVHKNSQKLAS